MSNAEAGVQLLTTMEQHEKHPERLVAQPETLEKLNLFMTQVEKYFNGAICPTKSELMNLVITSRASELSSGELQSVWRRLFDPVKFSRLVTKKLAEAKKRGETVSVEEVLQSLKPEFPPPSDKPKRQKVKSQLTQSETEFKKEAS